jgi:hypothetical protein
MSPSRIVDGKAEPMTAAARKAAGRCSLEREENAVIAFWRRFLAATPLRG